MAKKITKQELARIHGKTVRTIENWVKDMGCPHYKYGADIKFVESEVDAWAKKRSEAKVWINRNQKK